MYTYTFKLLTQSENCDKRFKRRYIHQKRLKIN